MHKDLGTRLFRHVRTCSHTVPVTFQLRRQSSQRSGQKLICASMFTKWVIFVSMSTIISYHDVRKYYLTVESTANLILRTSCLGMKWFRLRIKVHLEYCEGCECWPVVVTHSIVAEQKKEKTEKASSCWKSNQAHLAWASPKLLWQISNAHYDSGCAHLYSINYLCRIQKITSQPWLRQ